MIKKIISPNISFNVSGPTKNVENLDNLIELIRDETGLKLKRSGLIHILMQICYEGRGKLILEDVYNEQTLKAAIVEALKN